MQLGKDFDAFKNALGERESSNDYSCVNKFGFLGRFQFGKPRLYDLGVSIDGWKPEKVGKIPDSYKKLQEKDFLKDCDLQDKLFEQHVLRLALIIQRRFPEGVKKYSLSGLVAGAHLKGLGGVKDFLEGNNNADALGTTVLDYVTKFANYEIV